MENIPVIILGPGYTGSRLAQSLIQRNIPVFAVARNPEKLRHLADQGVVVNPLGAENLPQNARLVYSVPPVPDPEGASIRQWLERVRPHRLIYISSTSVYGKQIKVDELSPIEMGSIRGDARIREELSLSSGPWRTLIFRPAAIYGPGRGVHVSVREGKAPRGAGTAVTSRIHVDDLVRLIEAGLDSSIEGAWPVADQLPCPTSEIAVWCGQKMEPAQRIPDEGRSVDGSAIFRLLGTRLQWPTWKTGVPASIAVEKSY